MREDKVTIYVDGACAGNPGPGGWGAVLFYKYHKKELYGSELVTTNNQMELMAAIKALEALKKTSVIDIYTDSQYIQKGVSEWLVKWKANNWLTSNKKPVKNKELWQKLDQVAAKHTITWHWVKGHSGNIHNERADLLAVKGRNEAKLTAN